MRYNNNKIYTIERFERVRDYEVNNFVIRRRKDVLLLNEIIEKFGIFPEVRGNTEKYMDLLNRNIRIKVPGSAITNPKLVEFKEIHFSTYPVLSLQKILSIDRKVFEKASTTLFGSTKASELQKIGHIPNLCVTLSAHFEFDADLTGMKFGNFDLEEIDEETIMRLFEQIDEFDEVRILLEKVDFIPTNAKIRTLRIQSSRIYRCEDMDYDVGNLPDNPHIKTLICDYKISNSFEDNYTLTGYEGRCRKIREIVERNTQLWINTRFVKMKPARDS